ncbi:peptide/nickel transport system ATP-binding protein [Pararhizobium capsulatum DSM 1112]|uniref:Peptide/nickel transport system ATP-binding protein n=1 Tax=Pararhizobium capsulatum DSM 1112 TaxID=1121113 RepID=A0ABU0BXC1_9HYPH|nr:ABC transporter ATP-binding protein [Pararhizobium capsulatum]MDQ0322923.1 peptide/nickel transport system ATP-binding protein [Pararhizobium capsulatum DSM 1112]
MTEPLLSIDNLHISFPSDAGPVSVVKSVSLTVGQEIVAIVGESGSGKSLTGRAVMGLLTRRADVTATRMTFQDTDLQTLNEAGWSRLRGSGMGLILQDPKFSLNPAHRVGRQVEEALLLHTRLPARERKERALDMLDKVGLPDPLRVYSSYPAALSGGMGQRVMIAAMLINRPKLIIADEPTSALDRGLQDQVLTLLRSLTEEFGMGLILISHDLQQVSRYADRVIVMRRGEIVERLPASELAQAKSAYTRGLWAARPSAATHGTRLPVFEEETPA